MLNIVLVALSSLLWLLWISLGSADDPALPRNEFLYAVALVITSFTAARLLQTLVMAALLRNARARATSELLHALIAIAIYLVTALLLLRFGFNQNPIALLATSTILSAVIGLALQPTLGNMFSGVSIEIERPLRIGDYVCQGELEGRVEALRWRSVSIRTAGGSLIVMPNAEFTSRAIEIIPHDIPVRQMAHFTVPGDVPPGRVKQLGLEVLRSDIPALAPEPAPYIIVTGVDALSGNLRYGARFYTTEFLDRSQIVSQIIERLWYRLSRAGIDMLLPGLPEIVENEPLTALRPHRLSAFQVRPAVVDTAWLEQALPGLGPEAAAALAQTGRSLRYAADEILATPPGFGAAIVLEGRLREELEDSAIDLSAEIEQIRNGAPPERLPLLDEASLQAVVSAAAPALGPLTSTLVRRYASRTDDLYLIYRTLAQSVSDVEARERLIACGPARASRALTRGAVIGWGEALGLNNPGSRCWAVAESEILWLAPECMATVLGLVADRPRFIETLRRLDPSCSRLNSRL